MWAAWLLAAAAARHPPLYPHRLDVCDGASAPEYPAATQFLTDAASQTLAQVESNHIVALVPHSASLETGEAAVSAALYAALPRLAVDGGTGFETALQKVVLVGLAEDESQEGFFIPPCGAITDGAAVDWLTQHAPTVVNGPQLLAARPSRALDNQVPFVDLVLGKRNASGVLPIVMGKQTPHLAKGMGELLKALVQGGPYEQQRVLFVFAADLSRNLEKKWAAPRDAETVQKVCGEGFGSVLEYFDQLKGVQAAGENRRPVDYGGVLAAMKLAEYLELRGAAVRVASSGDFLGATDRNDLDKVRGYASVLFTRDDRTAGEKLSAAPVMPEGATPTTTTTPPPTTVVPPPTMSPAPFGASPPTLVTQRAKFSARRFLRALL